MSKTLCGTCRHWDRAYAERRDGPVMANRIAPCLWGKDFVFPWWCGGLRGDRFTNELGVTKDGCDVWEAHPDSPEGGAADGT